ncbi:Apolipoprotein N-acyltransferase [Pasteurella testudinis DSM 23072]|uniref:Apolipoprotein N-acyltransferase n=1 Tax=Pasteurella testudinis DSM 23072 TaxID=1122938 RepID=A0A1W1US98_9PAST|nr:apolipoprotein N-acyltransferase [Pasteurella testudinis]SMB83701.1 Apolipoprotein N-acyltransferase [Pasteurella testudinis DSM 23072]SUB50995.1 apolipoprotein N-acyltransferase [Pasteurella testudinis]
MQTFYSYPIIKILVSIILGASGVCAFSPFDIWPLAYVSVGGLIVLATQRSHKTALYTSYFWALGFFTFGINWIHVSIHLFGGVPLLLSYIAVLLLAAYLSLYPLLFAYLIQRFQIKSAVVLAIVWTFTEFLRGWVMTGFPWLQFGYSQIDSPFFGIAPILGVQGLTFFVVWISGLLINIGKVWLQRDERALLVMSGSVLTLLFLSGAAFYLSADKINYRTAASQSNPDRKLTVTLVQGNIEQNLKWDPQYFSNTIAIYQNLIAPHLGKSDLIILPEAAIPTLENQVQPLLHSWQIAAEKSGSEIIVGTVYHDEQQDRFYNSAIVLGDPQNPYQLATANRYNKHHLVPFGEYVPLESLLRPLGAMFDLPMSNFKQGDYRQTPLKAKGVSMATAICYEIILGAQLQHNIAASENDFILTISNDAWFGDSIGPWQHFQMARMRALENGKAVIRATNTGITAFIGSKGQVLRQAPQFEATTLTTTLTVENSMTPYTVFGDKPLYILSVLLLALHALTALFRRKLHQLATVKKE